MENTMDTTMDKRTFIKKAALGAGALTLGGTFSCAKPASKNDILSIGIIGTGGRVRNSLLPSLNSLPGVQINAVCDTYSAYLKSAHASAGGRDREIMQTDDYRRILDRKDIDAVVIATPDHWHAPQTVDACNAGKDVYCEKPLTHKLEESEAILKAQKKNKTVIQVGAQTRSMPHVIKLRERMKSGAVDIGPIHRIHMQWNRNKDISKWNPKIKEEEVNWKMFLGNAPDQPFDPFRMRTWRWMWDFGNGALSDLMVHWLDAANWLLDVGMPDSIVSVGGNYTSKGVWEAPDTIQSIFNYPDHDLQMNFVATFSNDHEKGSMRMMGEKGTIYIDRGRYEITGQKETSGEIIEQEIASEGERGGDDYPDFNATALHLQDWVDAIRNRTVPSCPPEEHLPTCEICHYGNIAYLEERLVKIPQKA
jgi:predicted dehydrogenase